MRKSYIIRDWYDSNGNFRAWPYSLNRGDQDNVPAIKLDPLNTNNYTDDETDKLTEIQNRWRIYMNKENIKTSDALKEHLLKNSFCNKEWAECNSRDLKYDWKEVYELVIERNLLICREWYKELKIDELIPSKKEDFSSIFDKRKWDLNPKEWKEEFQFDGENYWISKPTPMGNSKIYYFLSYNENDDDVLIEDGITFGILEKEPYNFIKKLKIPKKYQDNYEGDRGKSYLQGTFTLISHDESSYFELLNNLKEWLLKIQNQERKLTDSFIESLSKKHMGKLKNKNGF